MMEVGAKVGARLATKTSILSASDAPVVRRRRHIHQLAHAFWMVPAASAWELARSTAMAAKSSAPATTAASEEVLDTAIVVVVGSASDAILVFLDLDLRVRRFFVERALAATAILSNKIEGWESKFEIVGASIDCATVTNDVPKLLHAGDDFAVPVSVPAASAAGTSGVGRLVVRRARQIVRVAPLAVAPKL
jgi:hypothetical protein